MSGFAPPRPDAPPIGYPLEQAPKRAYLYPVSEIYGAVCQGEGQLIGRPTIFVRLGGCDYRCSWCDSLYAVLPQHRNEWVKMDAEAIADRAFALLPTNPTGHHATLSGGNPAIHPCGPLVQSLHDRGFRVAIETQGSVAPEWLPMAEDITLSPKPPSSGNITPFDRDSPLARCLKSGKNNLRAQGTSMCLKVVVFNDADYEYARAVHAEYPAIPFYLQAGTAVGIATRDDLCDALDHWQTRVLADPAMQDVSVLPQLHAILKGHARGI